MLSHVAKVSRRFCCSQSAISPQWMLDRWSRRPRNSALGRVDRRELIDDEHAAGVVQAAREAIGGETETTYDLVTPTLLGSSPSTIRMGWSRCTWSLR